MTDEQAEHLAHVMFGPNGWARRFPQATMKKDRFRVGGLGDGNYSEGFDVVEYGRGRDWYHAFGDAYRRKERDEDAE